MASTPLPPRAAFTLTELLVVITIITVLAGMLLPAIQMVKRLAQTATCASNQRQIGAALLTYTADNDGMLAPYNVGTPPASWIADDPSCQWGAWWYHQPLLGQYLDFRTTGTLAKDRHQVLSCPSVPANALGLGYNVSEGMNVRLTGFIGTTWRTRTLSMLARSHALAATAVMADAIERWDPGSSNPPPVWGITDDTANTNWNANDPLNVTNWRKRHDKMANATYLDGHVRCTDLRDEAVRGTTFFIP